MGSLYRSEEMAMCQLFLQAEAAYACISELGELGRVQFKDMNPDLNSFQRKFVNEVRRCEEMERKLRFLEKEIAKDQIPMPDPKEIPNSPEPREMILLETTFEKLEKEMNEVNVNTTTLKKNFLDLTELKHILTNAQTFFDEAVLDQSQIVEESGHLLSDADGLHGLLQTLRLGFVAGVVLRERIPTFERLLWRSCRGNVFLRQKDIETPLEDPNTGEEVMKSVFVIFFQGEQLKARVKKICEGFRATLYQCPETATERREMAVGIQTRIEDLNTVLSQSLDHRHRVLVSIADDMKAWQMKVRKIKAVYHVLNMFNVDVTQKYLIGECWSAERHRSSIEAALRTGTERSGSSVPSILNRMETTEHPPTYNCTNKFTKVFQSIVDSYGVAGYREVNPAPFTIVTFPFLFSLMFGDSGHGVLMFMAALAMVVMETKLMQTKSDNEIWNIFFGGRYIILLMGGFSIYAGLMYNDIFSKSFNIFGSGWYPHPQRYSEHTIDHHKDLTLDPTNNSDYRGHPYPFGMDPVWQMSLNKITWLNSFKMKISIIFGVSQMFFGVILSLQNSRYFRNSVNIFCEFLPQMIFLSCIFGYLIVLILYKWIAINATMSACAPSLLIDLINMFLLNYPLEPCSSAEFYDGQKSFQSFLLLMALVCVPWLLIAKPIVLKRQNSRKQVQLLNNNNDEFERRKSIEINIDGETQTSKQRDERKDSHKGHEEEEEFSFGEAFVHQCIHTIEYCLGCISHTASYLRLWALSLAHAELSEVLWNMVFRIALKMSGYTGLIAIFILFTPWAVLTIAILLLMEGLSAFLHTLRLHWVEFQSKFYKGDGYLFDPFRFDKILEVSADD